MVKLLNQGIRRPEGVVERLSNGGDESLIEQIDDVTGNRTTPSSCDPSLCSPAIGVRYNQRRLTILPTIRSLPLFQFHIVSCSLHSKLRV